jgi:GTPase
LSESKPLAADSAFRAGFVAILGPPNAGKSTLMNRILGQKLAIVTAKPQTTRSHILGIHTTDTAQIMFVDTPGLHDENTKLLNNALNEAVVDTARKCDVGVILVDLSKGWQDVHEELRNKLFEFGKPTIILGTKSDLVAEDKNVVLPPGTAEPLAILRVCGTSGSGTAELETALAAALPESPPLYDEDVLTDRPVRWLAGELVREAVFELLGQELPYSMAVDVIKYDESSPELVRIDANILVMRDSQKRIVVGKGGAMVKKIGIRARKGIEQLIDGRVHLKLFVKIDPKWLKNARRIEELGYH